MISDVSNDPVAFAFGDETFFLDLLNLGDRGTVLLRISEKYPLVDTASSQNT
jgi:hypothetical protein